MQQKETLLDSGILDKSSGATHHSHDKKSRLKFIDMARSIAIIMMLEGHFTGAALAAEYRSDEYIIYTIWHIIHGLTSPLFFTCTGVIFVYLLSANNKISYHNNVRVGKGFKRVGELLFWGYLIQLNVWSIIQSIYYGSDFHLEWFYAFHVLQSIAIGIFFLLIIYGVYKWIGRGALYWYYLVGGLIMFGFYSMMKQYINMDEQLIADGVQSGPNYLPHGAPSIIQNMFYGPFSDFSFVRYSGYTILGGMLGSIIRLNEDKAREWWFGTSFIVIGLVLNLFIQPTFRYIDWLTEIMNFTDNGVYELNSTAFIRFGQVMILLGILMLIDARFNVKAKLFLKMGQNTLPIYIVHVIILYGGVFGFGLKPNLFDENLNPYMSAGISVLFITLFVLMVKYIEPLERMYMSIIKLFHFKTK